MLRSELVSGQCFRYVGDVEGTQQCYVVCEDYASRPMDLPGSWQISSRLSCDAGERVRLLHHYSVNSIGVWLDDHPGDIAVVRRRDLVPGDCFRYQGRDVCRLVVANDDGEPEGLPESWLISNDSTATMDRVVVRLYSWRTNPEGLAIPPGAVPWSLHTDDKPYRYVRGEGWVR